MLFSKTDKSQRIETRLKELTAYLPPEVRPYLDVMDLKPRLSKDGSFPDALFIHADVGNIIGALVEMQILKIPGLGESAASNFGLLCEHKSALLSWAQAMHQLMESPDEFYENVQGHYITDTRPPSREQVKLLREWVAEFYPGPLRGM